jgi:transcriptional regulator with XRE-family HTH domain
MKYKFGEKIRSVREKKGVTLKEIAGKADISESLLSQIERNKISPAIDTLLRIADSLDIDFEYLFSDYKAKRKVNIVRVSDRNEYRIADVLYYQLSKTPGQGNHEIEAYLMEIKPNGLCTSIEYGHPGKELGVIIEGSGVLTIGGESYSIESGDSVSFDSSLPHKLENTGTGILKTFWVITPPKLFK